MPPFHEPDSPSLPDPKACALSRSRFILVPVLLAAMFLLPCGPARAENDWPQPPDPRPRLEDPYIWPVMEARVVQEEQPLRFRQMAEGPDRGMQLAALDSMKRLSGFEEMRWARDSLRRLATDASQSLDVRAAALEVFLRVGGEDATRDTGIIELLDSAPEIVLPLDRAMALHGDERAIEHWMERIARSDRSPILRRSAMEALAHINHRPAETVLMDIVDRLGEPIAVRIAATEALAMFTHAPEFQRLERLAEGEVIERWMAARLLGGGWIAERGPLLERLLADPDAAVAGAAAATLAGSAPERLLVHIELMRNHRSANVRATLVKTLIQNRDPRAPDMLADLLDDRAAMVRRLASRGLAQWAGVRANRESVVDIARSALESESWRTISEGVMLAAMIEERALSDAVATHLGHERIEVRRAVIPALGVIGDDRAAEMLVRHAEGLLERLGRFDVTVATAAQRDRLGDELDLAMQAMGRLGEAAGFDLARRLAAKTYLDYGGQTEFRVSAIWALGFVGASELTLGFVPEPSPEYSRTVNLLQGRLTDESIQEPEREEVRRMAAVSLGRMRARAALPALERYVEQLWIAPEASWAIGQIGGELPEVPMRIIEEDFFINALR
ncbi:MAG: hypothetical protein JJU36_17330 [Phycisphaeraceae bacterium]|nr:hypothetical protein [Phycisphaeraceae bacterium]